MSAAGKALEVAQAATYFHDASGEAFARFPVRDHFEVRPVRSTEFRTWLQAKYYGATERALASRTLSDVLSVLEARAIFDGDERVVHLRTAQHDGAIYIDLCDADWQVLRVDKSGWRLDQSPPVLFRRYRAMRSLPVPVAGGSLEALRVFLRVRGDDDWRLIVVWLVTAFVSGISHLILYLHGEQGAAKSSAQRRLVQLTDPSEPAVRRRPRDEEQFAHIAPHTWVLSIDNVSVITEWLSDGLCAGVTGDGDVKRRLYTDDEDVVRPFRFVVVMNGIPAVADRGDLLDRTAMVELAAFDAGSSADRRTEAELDSEFASLRPRIFGALMSALAKAMSIRPGLKVAALPRMADVGLWGTAIERALGWPEGSFLDAYERNRAEATDAAIEGDPATVALLHLAEKNPSGWKGAPTEFFCRVTEAAEFLRLDTRASAWPRSPKALANALRRTAPYLRTRGWAIESGKSGKRFVHLRPIHQGETQKAAEPASQVRFCSVCANLIPADCRTCEICDVARRDAEDRS